MIPDFFVNIQDEEADEEGKRAMTYHLHTA